MPKKYNRAANLGSFLYPRGKRPSKTALKNAAKMQAPDRMTKPVAKPVVTKPAVPKPKKVTAPKPEKFTPFSASAKGPLYPG